ncbi:hypothetical protein B9Q04_15840 [Candidatus Marsarchaeota G2 archaeon BE_D]|uniref:ABC transmembrane type-2 domain-containing protein n=1 Tax=Candidatus Marsarchaeota G2 archaeon BE_D TaxID=1978158 RepID=A0A2R6C6G2_9ARCH|nr:MAG: hypothetical protein B9Q04_15840 [Candidatus Marsarchaeota G2 archaeon BE_D]
MGGSSHTRRIVPKTPFTRSTAALTLRWLHRIKREKVGLAASVIQPVVWLLLFGSVFSRIVTVSTYSYIAFMTGGVVIMTTFNGALNGGVELLFDRESRMLYRLLTSPITPSSIIASRLLFVLGVTSAQSLAMLLLAALVGVGVAAGALGVVLIVLTGVLLGVGILLLSMALAFTLRGHEQFFSILGFVTLPITFASAEFAPIQDMPHWLQTVAMLNPLTYAINGVRSLVLTGLNWGALGSIMLVLGLFDAAMFSIAVYAMRRAIEL